MACIAVVAPRRGVEHAGNQRTANRWCRRLTDLGHLVLAEVIEPDPLVDLPGAVRDRLASADLMITLHARRTAAAARWWKHSHASRPLIVGLAGTDLYRDLPEDEDARASLAAADRLVTLQPAAIDTLRAMDAAWGAKAMVVFQSLDPPLPRWEPHPEEFRVVVLAHLRDEKAPLLAAHAVRRLPETCRVAVHLAGEAYEATWAKRAAREAADNPRFVWHRSLPPTDALALLSTAHLAACTSRLEGGANAVTEALAIGVPVVGTAMDGNIGLLGTDYAGLTPVGDAGALGQLLLRLSSDREAYEVLRQCCGVLQSRTAPAAEREAWRCVLRSLGRPFVE